MSTPKTPIETACEAVGSQAEMARILGVSPAMVNQLVNGSRPVPIEHCYAIEKATNAVVTRRDLRPDDWQKIWPDLADTEKPVAEVPQPPSVKAKSPFRRAGGMALPKTLTKQGA